MRDRRVWMALLGAVAVASIAAATVWQWNAPSADRAGSTVDTAPSSRSIFPKVLNH
jgi:hypothetical protein